MHPTTQARADGLPITLETTPHHLTWTSDDVPDGATYFKCAPPLRDAANMKALQQAVSDGQINAIASDHSPAPPGMRKLDEGDFLGAWGGVAGLQYTLPAVNTVAKVCSISVQAKCCSFRHDVCNMRARLRLLHLVV